MTEVVPLSVIVPTLGRVELLPACLESLAACDPRAQEVIVVTQGSRDTIAAVTARYRDIGARSVWCDGLGRGLGLNVGLREAVNDVVLVTDDDCRVSPTWVGVAWERLAGDPDTILTGRVLADGDPDTVPATIDDAVARDHVGPSAWSTLYGGNMGFHRGAVLAMGGFDEAIGPSAEDDELSYRWVRAGKRIRYDPELQIWHTAWRTPEQIADVYTGYARGQGAFYGKHLRRGDLHLLGAVARELCAGLRSLAAGLVHRQPRWADPRRGILRGLPAGIWAGWHDAEPSVPSPGVAAASSPTPDGRLRRVVRSVGPLHSTWHLLRALGAAIKDGPRRNRRRVDHEFAVPDPWDYAGNLREQECLQHQARVLERARAGRAFDDACEIGCAEGHFTEILAKYCHSVLAVDLSDAALARARQRRDWGDQVRFAHFDLRTDALPGTFDMIVIAGVLEYLDRPSALHAAREKLVAALQPGGWLYVVTTRVPVAEKAWWGKVLPRGARINEYVARHRALNTLIREQADWYVISLFEKAL